MDFDAAEMKSKIIRLLHRWGVPSASVSVVRDNEVLFSGGVGLYDNENKPADARTLYQIASCTKAFTAAAAAILSTEGKLDLDAPAARYLPGFRMGDEQAGACLTIRDFLSHRSGLPRHEYAWYGTGFSREQLMRNLRDLPLNAPIRYRFQYSNFNYLIAGCLLEAVCGKKIEDILEEKLLQPLGMERSFPYLSASRTMENSALPFGHDEEYGMTGTKRIDYYRSPAEDDAAGQGDPTAAAGCIVSCAEDMAKWLKFLVNGGKTADGRQFIGGAQWETMLDAHISLGSGGPYAPEQCMTGYALGWEASSYRGRRMLQHGGNLPGFTTCTAFLPEEKIGVYVSVNMNVCMLADAIALNIIDSLLDAPDAGWDERMYAYNESLFQKVQAFFAAGTEKLADAAPVRPLADYAGDYEAPGYRRFRIECDGSALTADFNTFRTALRCTGENRFATCGVIGELPAGLALTFDTDEGGSVRTLTVLLGSEKDLKPIVFTRK